MSLAIATANNKYVFRRDFTRRAWENISGDGSTCRVQVKKAGDNYVLKIIPQNGKSLDLQLSRENRIHFTEGFIQVPVPNSKELYGIKFESTAEGDGFYSKMIGAVGVPHSCPKTTIGSDGIPNPVGVDDKKPLKLVHQSLPQSTKPLPSHGPVFHQLPSQPPKAAAKAAALAKASVVAPSKGEPPRGGEPAVVKMKANAHPSVASNFQPVDHHPSQFQPMHQPSPHQANHGQNEQVDFSEKAQARMNYEQKKAVMQEHPGHFVGQQFYTPPTESAPPPPVHKKLDKPKSPVYINFGRPAEGEYYNMPFNQPGFTQPGSDRSNGNLQQNEMFQQNPVQAAPIRFAQTPPQSNPLSSQVASANVQPQHVPPQFAPTSPQPAPVPPRFAPTPSVPPQFVPTPSVPPQFVPTSPHAAPVPPQFSPNSPLSAASPHQHPPIPPQPAALPPQHAALPPQPAAAPPRPTLDPVEGADGGFRPQSSTASPRPQRALHASPQPGDINSVAETMVDALNRLDEGEAKAMFDNLMNLMKQSGSKCEIKVYNAPSQHEPVQFTLNIQVEFQSPNKDPLPIFLYNVSPDNSISVLSTRVEQEFYIPRLSQNWIIGTRLVKGNELNRPIKDFGIKGGEGVSTVSVYMYVLHTRKAQVPNEAVRVRQQHFEQQQQNLQQLQQQAPSGHLPPTPRLAWQGTTHNQTAAVNLQSSRQ